MTTPSELGFATRLGIDVVAIFICAYALYYRRYGRRELLTAFAVFNIGLFAVVSIIAREPVGAGVGFGLFALLSIIRLRSEPFSNTEISYFFLALVIGVLDGIPGGDWQMVAALNVLVLGTAYVVDHPHVEIRGSRPAIRWQQVILDTVHPDEPSLRADLERRLGVDVASLTVSEVDYVRDITTVVVGCRGSASPRAGDERPPVDLLPVHANGNGSGHAVFTAESGRGWSSITPES